jgi:hypothetical protein
MLAGLMAAAIVHSERIAVPINAAFQPDQRAICYRATRWYGVAGMQACGSHHEPLPTVKKFCHHGALCAERGIVTCHLHQRGMTAQTTPTFPFRQ